MILEVLFKDGHKKTHKVDRVASYSNLLFIYKIGNPIPMEYLQKKIRNFRVIE